MNSHSTLTISFLGLLLLTLSGCTAHAGLGKPAAPYTVAGKHLAEQPAADQDILAKLASMQPGDTQAVGEVSIEAGQSYIAASGARCMPVTISRFDRPESARQRLACANGQSWFFSHNVFVTRSGP